jgi:WD40 repeat protein
MKLKIWVLVVSLIIFGGLGVLDAQDDMLSAYGVKWSPDGRWIAANTSAGVWVVDTENPDAEPQIYYEGEDVQLIAFNPSNSELALVMIDLDEYAYKNGLVNLSTGEAREAQLMAVAGVDSALSAISAMSRIFELRYTADGEYVIMTMDGLVYLYEPSFRTVYYHQLATEYGNTAVSVSQIADTNNFLVLNWAESDRLVMINRDAGLLSSYQPEHTGDVLYYFDDTRAILPDRDGIYIFDFGAEEEELLIAAPEGNRISASAYFAGTDSLLLGGYGFWQVVDVATGEANEIVHVESNVEHTRFVAFDFKPDGSQFVSLQTDGMVTIWDMETGDVMNSWQAFDNAYGLKWG